MKGVAHVMNLRPARIKLPKIQHHLASAQRLSGGRADEPLNTQKRVRKFGGVGRMIDGDRAHRAFAVDLRINIKRPLLAEESQKKSAPAITQASD